MRSSRRLRAAVAMLAAIVLLPACKPMDDALHAVFGRSMRDQPSFDPYENPLPPAEGAVPFASPNFPASPGQVMMGQADGMTQDLPPFTLAMMAPPGAPEVNALENPVPATEASLARGEVLYARNCAVCHSASGVGAEAPIIEKLPLMAAYDLATGAATGFSDGYIYGMIRIGRGLMPAYGHRVTHYDRWHIVNYVRQLQAQAGGAPEPGGGAPGDAPGAGTGAAGDTAAPGTGSPGDTASSGTGPADTTGEG